MKTNWTVLVVNGKEYYTLKEVCKELGYKTQKSFIEKYSDIVEVFKGIVAGKFVSVDTFNSLFGYGAEGEEETLEQDFADEKDIPLEVKKKFAKVLVSKFHPDNNGDKTLFLWANRLKKHWERLEEISQLHHILTMEEEEFVSYMKTYSKSDKKEILARRGYDEYGNFVF